MKYSLRSLMIAAVVLPPLLALGWFGWRALWREAEPEVPVLHSFMPNNGPDPTPEEWAAAIEKWKRGELIVVEVPASSAPAPNPPKK